LAIWQRRVGKGWNAGERTNQGAQKRHGHRMGKKSKGAAKKQFKSKAGKIKVLERKGEKGGRPKNKLSGRGKITASHKRMKESRKMRREEKERGQRKKGAAKAGVYPGRTVRCETAVMRSAKKSKKRVGGGREKYPEREETGGGGAGRARHCLRNKVNGMAKETKFVRLMAKNSRRGLERSA